MRVIAGSAKGRKLKSSLRHTLRPTSDKVKEALFNILGSKVHGVRFLDLFAGTGGIGIEALSRGAKNVTFVEKNSALADLVRANVQNCGFANFEIINCDALRAIVSLHNRQRKFGIVFVDPPYSSDLALKTLQTLAVTDLLDEEQLIIVEHGPRNPLPQQIGSLYLQRIAEFGDTLLSFYRQEEAEPEKETSKKNEC